MNHNSCVKKIENYEKLYRKNASLDNSWGFALRLYAGYRLAGNAEMLDKAGHIAKNIYAINFHFLEAYLLSALISLDAGSSAAAQAMMDKLKPHKNALKGSPVLYAAYTCILGRLELKKGKTRQAKKLYSSLEAFNNSEDLPEIDVFLGGFALELGNFTEALEYLIFACEQGANSVFLYIFLYDFFTLADTSHADAPGVLKPFLLWGMSAGADLDRIINKWKSAVLTETGKDTGLGKRLYALYPYDFLLKKICEAEILNAGYSEESFYYYKEAENRQLASDNILCALVVSAFRNGVGNISRYSIERFLAQNPDDYTVKPFLYHILLRAGDYSEAVQKYKSDMIRLGAHCLENGEKCGAYLGSIYKFLLENLDGNDTGSAAIMQKAAKALRDELFIYDVKVKNPKAHYIRVFEKEKKEARMYALKNGAAEVTAASAGFACHPFDAGMKNIIESEISIKNRIDADFGLCRKLAGKGTQPLEMLLALSSGYISRGKLDDEGTQVLEQTAREPAVSKMFLSRLSAALGAYYASNNNYKKAVACYNDADENFLDARSIENKLLAYISAGEYAEASAIIAKKTGIISDKTLFYAVKQLAAQGNYNAIVKDAATRLTLNSWHDKALASIALENEKISHDEMLELSRVLAAVGGGAELELDEKIVFNAVKLHRFDASSQKVFTKVCERSPDSACIEVFAQYAAYEMIINGVKPEYETLETLEKIVTSKGRGPCERIVTYALCHTYVNFGIVTFNSDELISRAVRYSEEDGFIFPVLKDVKDKKLTTPYIERNQPFIHRGGKGKHVWLYYKVRGGRGDYVKKQMRYVRFGLYAACVPFFYGERLDYYFSEEIKTGSIVTMEDTVENNEIHLVENSADLYYIINNAVIYESMFKYEEVERIITDRLKELPRIKGWLM